LIVTAWVVVTVTVGVEVKAGEETVIVWVGVLVIEGV
jgi:hypothetical protein